MLVDALSVVDTLLVVKQHTNVQIEKNSTACTAKPDKIKNVGEEHVSGNAGVRMLWTRVEGSRCEDESGHRSDPSPDTPVSSHHPTSRSSSRLPY